MISHFELPWSGDEPLGALILERSWQRARALAVSGEVIPELAPQIRTAAKFESHSVRVDILDTTRRSFAQAGQASMTCIVGGGPWECWIRRINYFRMLAEEADRVLGQACAREFWNWADVEAASAPRSFAPWRWLIVRRLSAAVRAREGLRLPGGDLRIDDPTVRFAERRTGSNDDRPAQPRPTSTDRRERTPGDSGIPETDDDREAPPVEDLGL